MNYLCYTNHPIIQIFYLFVAIGGFLMYAKYGLFEHIPNEYLSKVHWYTGTLCALFCYYSFYLACKVEPGNIENRNLDYYLKKYKFDGILFMDNNKCPTCKLKKFILEIFNIKLIFILLY